MAAVDSSTTSKETAPAATKWLLTNRQPTTVTQDAVKLFCVPQAGMGAWVFQAWAEKLAPHIQVMPIECPGHGSRMKEPRLTDLCQLSIQAADAIEPHIRQGSYALFGHSMGAWIVWEILLEITRRGLPLPVRLFVSGNRAPSLHGAEHDVDPVRMHTLTPDKFWPHFKQRYGENKHLNDPAMQAYMYPMLKDDFQMVETYTPSQPDAKTTVPTVVIGGALDKRYTGEQIMAWSQHTTTLKEVWLGDQGHNYIADCPHGLIAMIRLELGPLAQPQQQPQQQQLCPAPAPASSDAADGTAAAAADTSTDAATVVVPSTDAAADPEAPDKSAGSPKVPWWRSCCTG